MYLWSYVGCVVLDGLGELILLGKHGVRIRWRRDWTLWPILIPYLLAVCWPVVEFVRIGRRPVPLEFIAGAVLYAAATGLRFRGLIDLGKYFTPFIDQKDGQQLVDRGIYQYLRHPLYLGIIGFFIGMPLMLGAEQTWIFSLLGIGAILNRVYCEDRFLSLRIPGYREYKAKTPALIPKIF